MGDVRMRCPSCGVTARGKSEYLDRKIKCPKCQTSGYFVSLLATAPLPPTPAPIQPPPPLVATASEPQAETVAVDVPTVIATCATGAGLLLLALSTLMPWVHFGAGGLNGLAGDGKIFLAMTIVATVAYAGAVIQGGWLPATFSMGAVQCWATVAAFWMGSMVWRVNSVVGTMQKEDNPFAVLFATQITPGSGLILGLASSVVIIVAIGVTVFRHRPQPTGILAVYYTVQGLACLLGVGVASIVGTLPES